MPSDYPPELILIGYYIQNQDPGTTAQRSQFSQDLFDMFNGEIVTAAGGVAPPIGLTPQLRASLAMMAAHAPGGISQQAQTAVAAYVAFRGV
jgi:hypothetical protein